MQTSKKRAHELNDHAPLPHRPPPTPTPMSAGNGKGFNTGNGNGIGNGNGNGLGATDATMIDLASRSEGLTTASGKQVASEQSPLIFLTHKTKVNSVHRLWSNTLSERANLERFGTATQCHGHAYTISITFRAPVCMATGQVIAADLLEDTVHLAITEIMERKNLDLDISWFQNRPSTIENVCLFIWRNISIVMAPHPHDVDEVRVEVEPCFRGEKHPRSGLISSEAVYRGELVNMNKVGDYQPPGYLPSGVGGNI